ncbi:MAG TPA: hypothetical protein VMT86_17555 [Bryobacteraceae bacterium]|nr:hypothetical protein [Bryobacteraceae bacterium]
MAYLKGAFINLGAGLLGALPNIVIFQFNPDRVSRTPTLATPPPTPVGSGNTDATQQASGPTETYSFTLNLDASDQLASSNPIAVASGILPALSALELLMVPASAMTIDLASLVGLGGGSSSSSYQMPPLKLPTVLFFWGPYRIWPVTVNSLSVTETIYDELLNPVRAEVQVSLQVLTPNQMDPGATLAQGAYQYSLGVKQVMAALNLANTAAMGISGALSLPI